MSNKENTCRTKFYLDKDKKKLLGVCAGIADYTGINVLWIRIGMIIGVCMGFGLLIPLYLLIGWLAPRKPRDLYVNEDEEKFWRSVRSNPSVSTRDIKARFRDLDRRLADIERYYTNNNRRLAEEIDNL